MIHYNGKEYPTRTFVIKVDGTDFEVLIADTTLSEQIIKSDKLEKQGTLENQIDEQIYFYVEEGVLNLSAEEICKEHLDEEFELIEEII